jgi:ZIP family zinc transporter
VPAAFNEGLPYLLVAAAAGFAGGLVAQFWRPRVRARSAIQHFAAGAVLAAVASRVVPEVERTGTPLGILGGFAAGGLAMIGLKWLVVRFEQQQRHHQRLPFGLAAAAAVDTLLDGAIISAGYTSGQNLGTLLALTLAVELFFLNLSVGAEYRKTQSPRWHGVAATSLIAGLLLAGAAAAGLLLRDASPATVAVVLAIGAAALIYLIAEELLVEAIAAEQSILSTAMLFAGFLALIALGLISEGGR